MPKPAPPIAPAGKHEEEILRLLEGHRFLRRLPREELHALIRQASVLAFAERDMVFAQGDAGATVLVVVEGYVKLSSSTFGGREVVLEVAGPGAVFGELAVLNEWPRAADAAALSACRLLSIDGKQFVRTLVRAPEAMFEIIRLLSERLRSTTEQMTDGLDLPAPARLAKALMHLAALHSHPVKSGLRIDFQLSQRELGGMTGLTRESINKHLATWRDSGWVTLSDRYVTVLNPQRLQDLLRDHSLEG
jgi:CRP/FNR family transcriptional regulator, cyclic AMP receptor protein